MWIMVVEWRSLLHPPAKRVWIRIGIGIRIRGRIRGRIEIGIKHPRCTVVVRVRIGDRVRV